MNKYFYLPFTIILLFVIFGEFQINGNSPADTISNKLIVESGSRLAKEYNLSICTIGGGGDSKGLNLLSIGFEHRGKPLTIGEARVLIVNLTLKFLNDINNDVDLKPYLLTYPFKPSNIEVTVFFFDSKGESMFDPYPITVSARRDEVGFRTKSSESIYGYKNEFYESFDEALAIVNKQKNKKK